MAGWHGNVQTMEKSSTEPDGLFALSTVEECQRVVRVANPALVSMSAVTYYSGFRVLDDRFSSWLHGTYQQQILPGLLAAVRYGSDEKGYELLESDALILRNATDLLRHGSGRAGRLLLREGIPAGVKCLQKIHQAASQGRAEAHLATVFGARCGVFSIGERAAALAYVYLELRTGAPDWHDIHLQEKLADAAEVIGHFFQRSLPTERDGAVVFDQQKHHG